MFRRNGESYLGLQLISISTPFLKIFVPIVSRQNFVVDFSLFFTTLVDAATAALTLGYLWCSLKSGLLEKKVKK